MKSILVVDDDEAVRSSLAAMLRRSAWTVSEAVDGAEAITLFRQEPSDVVLTDLMMPRLDGLGVLAEVRAINPAVPVVMLSGFATIDRCREALQAGATDFVTKPCQSADLERVLNRALDRSIETEIADALRDRSATRLEFRVPAGLSWRPAAAALLVAHADAAGFQRRRAAIRLAFDEALGNAIQHGSGEDARMDVSVTATFDSEAAIIRVKDSGAGFDHLPSPELPSSEPGGRGIFLMKSFADQVSWEDGGRTCVLRFDGESSRAQGGAAR